MNFDNTKMILGNSEMFKPRADFQSIYNFKNLNHEVKKHMPFKNFRP